MPLAWRKPRRDDYQVAALWALSVGAALALRPFWTAVAGLLPACLWHRWSGLPCPGCGTTRALVRVLHGDVTAGLSLNPLAACAACMFVAAGLGAPAWLATGGLVPVFESRPRPVALAVAAVLVVLNWAWLFASGV